MDWLDMWAKWELICQWIVLGIAAVLLTIIIVYWLIKGITYFYKSHSKKYEYDYVLRKYVKRKANKDVSNN